MAQAKLDLGEAQVTYSGCGCAILAVGVSTGLRMSMVLIKPALVLLLNTGEETFRTLVPYLIFLATGLLAIEGPVQRWHERQVGRGEAYHEHGLAKAFPVFLAAMYGGYFGGGLSVILLAVLGLVSHESLRRLNALKQMIALAANVAAAAFFLFSGKVVWSAAIVMAIGALAGGWAGGLVADRIPPSVLRWIVVLFGGVISIVYFVR